MGLKDMEIAYQGARNAIESTYDGKCTIYEYKKVKNSKTKMTSLKDVAVVKNQPCRLSYQNTNVVSSRNNANSMIQSIQLFIAPEVQIKAGSKIVIAQNGVTKVYQKSGEPAVYVTHQEIQLELYQERT